MTTSTSSQGTLTDPPSTRGDPPPRVHLPKRPQLSDVDFHRSPFLVIWETTQACDLVCVHCRAEAQPCRDTGELSTGEARALMDRVRSFGQPLFVLTGGDPFKRPDLLELVRYGSGLGLRMGLTPSATPLVTVEALEALADAGLSRLAISLDGPDASRHDRFRGAPGSFQRSLEILEAARPLGIPTQVNSTVTRETAGDFEEMADLVEGLGISLWSVFFLVPTGRARKEDVATGQVFEEVFHRMYDRSRRVSFDIKSTAAPHYRRVVLQRQVAERRRGARSTPLDPLDSTPGLSLERGRGVNDGNGFVFVSHRGDIFPSGFLPLAAGNVRRDDLVEVYRNHPLFQSLRDPDGLGGKCGVCEYRTVCGGSRARAWALTGDPLAEEPYCVHRPKRWHGDLPNGPPAPSEGGRRLWSLR
jgi:AdoMet-dependent heme synthase